MLSLNVRDGVVADIDIVVLAVEVQAPAALRIVHPGRVADERAVMAAGAVAGVAVQFPMADQIRVGRERGSQTRRHQDQCPYR